MVQVLCDCILAPDFSKCLILIITFNHQADSGGIIHHEFPHSHDCYGGRHHCFGVGFIIAPASLGSFYGLPSSPTSEFVLRLYAMALIGIGLLAWLFRQSQNPDIQKPVLLAYFVTDFGGFLVALFAKLAGMMNAFGWSLVVLLLLFSAAYAYLRFAQQATR